MTEEIELKCNYIRYLVTFKCTKCGAKYHFEVKDLPDVVLQQTKKICDCPDFVRGEDYLSLDYVMQIDRSGKSTIILEDGIDVHKELPI